MAKHILSLLKRMELTENHFQQKKANASIKEDIMIGSTLRLEKVNIEFCAKSLSNSKIIEKTYFSSHIKDIGVLLRNKKSVKGKWNSSKSLELDPRLKLPPILGKW